MSLLNRNRAITRLAAPRGPKGEAGASGKSAYQIAVEEGYPGTEEQWLASLKGANGAPGPASTVAGPAGERGPAGPRGETGDASTIPGSVGPQGERGPQGPKGDDGAPGTRGADGAPGTTGLPGTSGAKGEDGAPGTQGAQGLPGTQGERGEQGLPGITGAAGSDATVTKVAVEAVLTGEISTHSHTGGGGDLWTIVKLGETFTSSSSSNVNVTGFAFTPAINKTYLIFGYFLLRTATATVGARPGVAWPTNLTDSVMRAEASNSTTAAAIRTWGARSTQNATSTGLASTADSHWGSLDGIMITSGTTSGNFQITLASETAGTNVMMQAGSILMYREL